MCICVRRSSRNRSGGGVRGKRRQKGACVCVCQCARAKEYVKRGAELGSCPPPIGSDSRPSDPADAAAAQWRGGWAGAGALTWQQQAQGMPRRFLARGLSPGQSPSRPPPARRPLATARAHPAPVGRGAGRGPIERRGGRAVRSPLEVEAARRWHHGSERADRGRAAWPPRGAAGAARGGQGHAGEGRGWTCPMGRVGPGGARGARASCRAGPGAGEPPSCGCPADGHRDTWRCLGPTTPPSVGCGMPGEGGPCLNAPRVAVAGSEPATSCF